MLVKLEYKDEDNFLNEKIISVPSYNEVRKLLTRIKVFVKPVILETEDEGLDYGNE